MKKICFLIIGLLILSGLYSATTFKMKQYPFYAGLSGNLFRIYGNDSSGSVGKFNFGGVLGYKYTPQMGFELKGSYGYTKPSDPEASGFTSWTSESGGSSETTVMNFDLGMRYNFLPDLGSNPYVFGGLGRQWWQADNSEAIDNYDYEATHTNVYGFLGGGFENRISEHVSLNINYKFTHLLSEAYNILGTHDSPTNISQFGVELVYNFGKGIIELVNLEDIEAVTFEFNSVKITSKSEDVIDYVEEALRQNPDLVLEIRGFTDNTGSDAVNMRMSKKRAMVVKQMLVDRGIAPTRLITTAMGHQNPVATNSTAEGRALNRRVEFYELNK